MRILREWAHRCLETFHPRRHDHELEEELRLHLELATGDAERRGHTREEAVRAARIRAGSVSQALDALRDQRGLPSIDALVRDLRFGARMLMTDRWATLVAVVALALAIAANNTVFAIVNAILLRDLPFDAPDRIVAIGTHVNNRRTLNAGVSYADFQDWRAAVETFEGLGAMRETTMNVGDERVAPERFIGSYLSANTFGLLRQQPVLGRDFHPDDERPNAAPVVILGHSLWRNRYGSDPSVLGRTIRVNGVPAVVIGVMPDAVGFPARSRLWQPLVLLPAKTLTGRDTRDLSAFGRLNPDVTIEQAAAALRGIETFHKRIVRGSDLPLPETKNGAASVILNEWLAATAFPGEDPIGRRIRLTALNGRSPEPEWHTITGIAPDIRQSSTEDASQRDGVVYVSYATNPLSGAGIAARSDADAAVVATVLREQIRGVDPDLPLFEVMRLDDLLATADERAGLRLFGAMFAAFALVALLLATVGLYAVTAYAAAQRTGEIGVRVALGATPTHIWWLVIRTAAWQFGLGLSIGMAGAIGIGGLLRSVLVGTSATDPVTLFAVAGLLAIVGVSACFLPARRAMRLDPVAALRHG